MLTSAPHLPPSSFLFVTTGLLVVVNNGFAIIPEIEEENGKFLREEVSDIIKAKS